MGGEGKWEIEGQVARRGRSSGNSFVLCRRVCWWNGMQNGSSLSELTLLLLLVRV